MGVECRLCDMSKNRDLEDWAGEVVFAHAEVSEEETCADEGVKPALTRIIGEL